MTNEQIVDDIIEISEGIARKKLAIRSHTPSAVYSIRMKALDIAGEMVKAKIRAEK